jgi:hypothetical protein
MVPATFIYLNIPADRLKELNQFAADIIGLDVKVN